LTFNISLYKLYVIHCTNI